MSTPRHRWSPEEAQAWYRQRPWPLGCNYIPATAVNQLEMWQEDTFDPVTIERELGWAADLGFNAVRVFLHDLLWTHDKAGFIERIDRFLSLAHGLHISTLFVLFDGVWDPFPVYGPQRPPRPGVHNSGWVQSPGAELLSDPGRHGELEGYIGGVISRFRDDGRILGWDLFNEPENPNIASYRDRELPGKAALAAALLAKTFRWARAARPAQPLTAGVWMGALDATRISPINRLMLEESDVISFHSYYTADLVRARIQQLQAYGRPVLLTEYLARETGSTFETILPLAKEYRVGAFNWGLVSGKTQTIYPWDSWFKECAAPEPWFHDILTADGTPYRSEEAAFIQRIARDPA